MASNGHIMAKWFDTEDAAADARDEFERGERTVEKKREFLVVGDRFVVEACDGGVQIGEVRASDMNGYHVVARFTQSEFDERAEHFNDEEGH